MRASPNSFDDWPGRTRGGKNGPAVSPIVWLPTGVEPGFMGVERV